MARSLWLLRLSMKTKSPWARAVCDEVHLNLAYRWFCRVGSTETSRSFHVFQELPQPFSRERSRAQAVRDRSRALHEGRHRGRRSLSRRSSQARRRQDRGPRSDLQSGGRGTFLSLDDAAFGGVSGILCAGPVYPSRFDEPVVEDDSELGFGLAPFAWRHFPCLRDLAQDEIQQFDRRLIGWKMTSRSHGAPELGVQGFDGVRGVNDAPPSDGKGEERMTCSQFRRQLCAIDGSLRPQTPASKSSSALRATSASVAR